MYQPSEHPVLSDPPTIVLAPNDPAGVPDEDDAPNRAERLAARLGGWAGALAERLSLAYGPCFTTDGWPAAPSRVPHPPSADIH